MLNRVLFYNSGGGIGDSIQLLPLIESIRSEFKDAKFFYLGAHTNHFDSSLKDLNCKIKTLDMGVKYFGFRWWHTLIVKRNIKKQSIESFDLVIDLQSKLRNTLILRLIPHKHFVSSCLDFKLSKPKINVRKEKKNNSTMLNAINFLFKKNCKLIDFDTSKIDKKFFSEAERLLPKNNYVGLSITQGNIYRKKQWPLKNVEQVCAKLNQNNKIPVFLIEKNNNDLVNEIKSLIPYALFPEQESSLASPTLVVCLAKKLDFAISIDNGIMHMLSLAKIPMITLFGPTDSEKFAPDYDRCIVLDSKKLYKTKNLSAINVEDVLQAAKQFVNF